jgi:hypothetical protein
MDSSRRAVIRALLIWQLGRCPGQLAVMNIAGNVLDGDIIGESVCLGLPLLIDIWETSEALGSKESC